MRDQEHKHSHNKQQQNIQQAAGSIGSNKFEGREDRNKSDGAILFPEEHDGAERTLRRLREVQDRERGTEGEGLRQGNRAHERPRKAQRDRRGVLQGKGPGGF
eukprot:2381649-Heterocapsa_arctica.AAC.1